MTTGNKRFRMRDDGLIEEVIGIAVFAMTIVSLAAIALLVTFVIVL